MLHDGAFTASLPPVRPPSNSLRRYFVAPLSGSLRRYLGQFGTLGTS
jgi:hypothetical protein